MSFDLNVLSDGSLDSALIQRMEKTRLWQIVKALPFSGGPSATKWVYLALNAVIAMVVVLIALALILVYVFTHDHHVDQGLVTGLIALVGITSSSATVALAHRARLKAKSSDASDSEVQPDA